MLQLDAVKLDMPEIRKTLGEVGDSLDLAGMKTRLDEGPEGKEAHRG